MVQVAGVTYRIESYRPAEYRVVRLLDDVAVGTFRSSPCFEMLSSYIDSALLRQIARTAMVAARTNWDQAGSAQLSGPGTAASQVPEAAGAPRVLQGVFGLATGWGVLGLKLDSVRGR